MSLPPEHTSLWLATAPGPCFPSLHGDVEVDVAVLGGGIVGLTAAILLKRAGKSVALIEANRLIGDVTGHTTAKVTSSHNLIYADLIDKHGEEAARIYGDSNQAALERIARFIVEEDIECDFERKPSYCYSESPDDLKAIEDEVAAAQKLGLPAHFVAETALPFPIAGAVRFDNQAQFHPRKYLLHLAQLLSGEGSHVFEETRALNVEEGNPSRVITGRGVVRAGDVIVATHFPILNRGLFFVRIHPQREYVVCAPIDPGKDPAGMYISVGSPTRSMRTAPSPDGLLLIVGGEKHRTGEDAQAEERYEKLEEFTRSRFGAGAFAYRWSTQDNFSIDRLPFIGRLKPGSDHLYVATGFSAWGMTNGTLAAMIVSDLILELANPWASLYDPGRITPRASARRFLVENLNVARHLVGDRAIAKDRSPADVQPGEGAIVDVDGEMFAAHRDEQGRLTLLSPACTHMGCLVSWNPAEKSWDCPCHGSRFDTKGKVIHGPAVEDLRLMRISAKGAADPS